MGANIISIYNDEVFISYLDNTLPDLWAFILCHVSHRQDAEDIRQEAACVAYRKFDDKKFSSLKDFRKWIFDVTDKLIKKHYRTLGRLARRESFVEQSEWDAMTASEEAALDAILHQEDIDALRATMEQLSDDEKHILKLRFYEKIPYKEISLRLHINENTLMSRSSRAIKKLFLLLEKNVQDIASSGSVIGSGEYHHE